MIYFFTKSIISDKSHFKNREKNHPSMLMLCFLPNISNLSAILSRSFFSHDVDTVFIAHNLRYFRQGKCTAEFRLTLITNLKWDGESPIGI